MSQKKSWLDRQIDQTRVAKEREKQQPSFGLFDPDLRKIPSGYPWWIYVLAFGSLVTVGYMVSILVGG